MTRRSEVLALVPARGGSKGVPRKNLRVAGGRTLLEWAVDAGMRARTVGRVVVTTDDDEVAAAAAAAGAAVIRRPADLAADDTPDLPVLRHAVARLAAEDYEPDAVAWLRPTAPLRTPQDVDGAVALLLASGGDAVRSACVVEHHPWWMRRLDGDRLVPFVADVEPARLLRRQDLPRVLRLNGAVDVVRTSSIPDRGGPFDAGDVRGYLMPLERSLDVDTEVDLAVADLLLRRGGAAT